jgi:TetR/AcrR family transcriptional repressor of multidrug resistance operon
MAPKPTIDRAAAVRRAMRTLVARHGLHGASMSSIAKEAGVAQGTAYAHYQSKEQLLVAAYLELKREMGTTACAEIDRTTTPHDRFIQVWLGVYRFLAEEPERAQFMLQLESSPYARVAHEKGMAVPDDPMMAEAAALHAADVLAPLDLDVLYDLAFWPAIRRAATGEGVDETAAGAIAEACWRAITT